jgi:hypothetical protein
MLKENRRRLTWQLGLLVFFWGVYAFTFTAQMYNLPPTDPNPVTAYYNEVYKPDPYTYYPFEYNPFNDRMTLIESFIIWVFMFYGCLRMYNIFRIIRDDDNESPWAFFWEMCETINNGE